MAREQDIARAFHIAAEAVRQRIRDDQKRVSHAEVREALEIFEREIFTDFLVGSLKLSATALAEFTATFNATPYIYLRVRLIEAVLFMLDHTDADLNEIAPLVGYDHPRSLSTAVKKMMGHTPMEERRLWREELSPQQEAKPPDIELPEGWQWVMLEVEDFRLERAPKLRQALAGGLTRRQGIAFILKLNRQLPQGQRSSSMDAFTKWMIEVGKRGSKEAAATLQPTVRQPVSRDLSQEDETDYLQRAAAATFAVQDRFAADWTEGPGTDGLPEVLARTRAIVFEQGSSLEEMKASYQLTTTELSRFSPNLGVSPWQYVLETRMEVTARLLCASPMPIDGISWNVGYAEPRQLRRAFHKWSGGMSPARYRRRAREAARLAGESVVGWMHWKVLEIDRKPGENVADMQRLIQFLEAVYWARR